MALMLKSSEMLYYLDLLRQSWTSAFDGSTLTQVQQRGAQWLRPPWSRELTDAEDELRRSLEEFAGLELGLHERPR